MAFLISAIHNLCVYAKDRFCAGKPVDFIADFLSRKTAAKATKVGNGPGRGIANPSALEFTISGLPLVDRDRKLSETSYFSVSSDIIKRRFCGLPTLSGPS